jgi:hypothetical protein
MVWLFERHDDALRVETRYDRERAEYQLIVQRGAKNDVERFTDADAFRTRLEQLEQQLEAERWERKGPFFLKDGWRL